MARRSIIAGMLFLASLLTLPGCNDSPSPAANIPGPKPRPVDPVQPRERPVLREPVIEEESIELPNQAPPPEAPVEMPQVLLSKGHLETCLVGVGDEMPDVQVKTLDGEEKSLSELYGELTVVSFFKAGHPLTQSMLTDLKSDFAARYADNGVEVVAVSTGDTAEEVATLAEDVGETLPLLLDPDGEAFDQIATRYHPRTYLLDAQGKILWFDLEYSHATWRDLDAAIRFALNQNAAEQVKEE